MAKKPTSTRYVSPPSPCPTESPTDANGWWLYLSPQWHAHIQGLVKLLENRDLWEGTEEEIDETISSVQQIEVGSIRVNEMVLDVRAQDGRLEKLVDGVWLDAGALDDFTTTAHALAAGATPTADFDAGVIDFGIPAGMDGVAPFNDVTAHALTAGSEPTAAIVGDVLDLGIPRGESGAAGSEGQGGIWELPEVTTDDQMCSAAAMLARTFADELQDLLENIDAGVTFAFETLENLLSGLGGVVPVGFPTAAAAVEWLHEGLTGTVIDWTRVNASDIQAIELAKNQIYCAMLQSDNFEDFWLDIDWLEGLPPRSFTITSPQELFTWENFKDWLEYIYNTLNGTNMGWLILAYGAFVTAAIDGLLPAENTARAMIAAGINTAQYRDSEMCDDCGQSWCREFDFTTGTHAWTNANAGDSTPRARYIAGVGWTNADAANARNEVRIYYTSSAVLTRMEVEFSTCGGTIFRLYRYNTSEGLSNLQVEEGVTFIDREDIATQARVDLGVGNLNVDQCIVITKITLFGTGNEPLNGSACP